MPPGFKLPPRGTVAMRERTRDGVSEGQPAAASVEPSPLEVSEQERGERDDVIRDSMAAQAVDPRMEGLLTGLGELMDELSHYGDGALKLYRYLSGQYNQVLSFEAATVKAEAAEQEVSRIKTKPGTIFIARRYTVLAPKGCKLRFYKNQISPGNLCEVFTAAQEGAAEIPGSIRLRDSEQLVATVLGAEAEGSVIINLEGDLVATEPVAW